MRKNKGVTLTILVITIIVMLIIFGITMSSADDLLRNSQKNRLKTNLYLIQARAETLLENYLFDMDGKDLKTISTDDIEKYLEGSYITDAQAIKSVGFTAGSTTIPDKDQYIYCRWLTSDLEEQGIDSSNIASGETFIVEYNIQSSSIDVGSTKGFSDGNGNSYHLLSELSTRN